MYRSQRWFLAFPLLLGLALSMGCSKSPIDRAQAFLDAGMAGQAVPLIQVEIQANPKNARAHLMLGQASLMLNDQAAARESFDRAVLLNPGWADKVGRAYLDAANKLISGGPSETRLAVAYLETAREKTRSLDKDIARSFRRAGLRAGSAELLRAAVQTDAALAQDDSVAAYLAIGSGQSPDLRIASMAQFLGQFPKSALRPAILVQIAQAEMAVGDRPKAKAYAEEAVTLPGDPAAATEARSLLEQIAGVERAEVEAGIAVQQAHAKTQQELARQKLIEQEARSRAEVARAEAEAANAKAEVARQERLAREQQQRQEAMKDVMKYASELPGRWYFNGVPANGKSSCRGGYIEFDTVSPTGSLSGAFVFPEGQCGHGNYSRFQGTLNGVQIEMLAPNTGYVWTGRFNPDSHTMTGDARGGSWVLRGGWSATKR